MTTIWLNALSDRAFAILPTRDGYSADRRRGDGGTEAGWSATDSGDCAYDGFYYLWHASTRLQREQRRQQQQ